MTQAVFGDDDGAVDDKAEVERAEAHQIGGDTSFQHTDAGEEHCDRDVECGDQCRPEIAEQREQDDDDQHSAFGEVAGNRGDGGVHQFGPVHDRLHHHVDWQGSADLGQPLGHARRYGAAVFPDPHHRRPDDNFMTVLGRGPHAERLAGADGRDLVEQDRHALARGDNGAGEFVGVAHTPVRANGKPFTVAVDDTRAGAGVIALQRRCKILQREAHRRHTLDVGNDEIFLGVAAKGVDASQTRRALELRRDDPVLHGPQVGRLVGIADEVIALRRDVAAIALQAGFAVAVTSLIQLAVFDRPHEDIAEPGRDRPHLRVHALRQVFLGGPQALRDLCPCEVDIGLLGENSRDLSEAVAAERPCIFEAGDAGERSLDGKGDLFFDLVR